MSTQASVQFNSSTTNLSNDPNDCKEVSKEKSIKQNPLNILTSHHDIKIGKQFILKLQKNNKNVTIEVKHSCKILHFSSDWSFEDVMATIDGLDPKDYPQLFIFVVDAVFTEIQQTSLTNCTKLQEKLLKFGGTRPLILQLTSMDENAAKIYYKIEDSFQFFVADQQPDNTDPFLSFLSSFCNGQYEDSELKVLNAVKDLRNTLVLRFLHTLELSDRFFGSLVLDVAENGSKTEFIAALDSPFINDGRFLSYKAQRHISLVFGDDDDPENDDSVLIRALQHQNSDIVDYLITYWSHLIQELPFEHRVKISTTALETNQLDVLSDLLDIADFPFPKDFKEEDAEHPRLCLIITERTSLKAAIQADNFDKIDEFVSNHSSHKFIYSTSNNSALTEAINLKKFAIFYYLKSLGMKGEKCDEMLTKLSKEDKQQAVKLAIEQRQQNVQKSQFLAPKSVMLLFMRSSIHNSRTIKPQQILYREKIIKWLEDIHKVAPEMIDVAASCKDLRIIFDFESHSVENLTLTGFNAEGSTYPKSKELFIGAKLTDSGNNITKQREQHIKGVLAHELCHYVMKLVYENQEHPYYKIMIKIAEMFEEIVKTIDKWSIEDSENPDDECNGIISTVFTLYLRENFHPELIVRVVQILAEFDNNQDKSQKLQDKYKILFDFWENQVIPDLRAFDIEGRESVRKMNRLMKLLKSLNTKSFTFNNPKDIKEIFSHKLTIITSNVPTLLLKEIQSFLQDTASDLFDTENVFVDPKVLKNEEILEDFKELLQKNTKLSVIVDCSSELLEFNVKDFQEAQIIFVVSNEAQHNKLLEGFKDFEIAPTKLDINYNWHDLTPESQEQLMDHKIEFQDWTGLTLLELLMPEESFKEPESSEVYKIAKSQALSDFSEVVDDELLNLLVDGSNIIIDEIPEDVDDRNFIQREFYKKTQEISGSELHKINSGIYITRLGQIVNVQKISEDQLLRDVEGKPVVLISDIAGSGKSWVMKNFAEIFRDDESVKWVTYVDLKLFINEFKAYDGEPDFATFMAEKILKSQHQFEAKIFQKLYKISKVLIFFDGFDEIAPDCAEFVSKLAQNFQQNGGNQLWIATRDFFEVDLREKLNTDAVYGITDLTFDDAVDLVAQKWMDDDNKFESGDETETDMEEEYKNYSQKAQKIVTKFHFNWLHPVGMPLLIKMIAETFTATKEWINADVTLIFKKYIQKLIKIWSHEKGKIREEASIECQELDYSLMQIHQYWAIASLFPEFLEILFPDYDPSEWPDVTIVACGLVNKIDEKIIFVHETYREYFVADYLAKALKRPKISEEILKVFNEILVTEKFQVIRMFLNDLVGGLSNLKQVKNLDQFFELDDFFAVLFMENLDEFADFFIENFKMLSYEKKLEILNETGGKIAQNLNDPNLSQKFQELIFDAELTAEDLKDLIMNQGLLQGVIQSGLDFIEFENFITKIESKTDREFIKKALTVIIDISGWKGNIFHHLCQSTNLSLQKFQKTLKICQNFLDFDDICGLIRHCNQIQRSVLHMVSNRSYLLCSIWQEIESFYKNHDASEKFKELIRQKDSQGLTVLCKVASYPDDEFYKNLWNIILHTFEDREELKDLLIENNHKNNQDNFIQKITAQNTNPEVIKLTFDVLKKNFTDAQFSAILRSKSYDGSNLLLKAFFASKNIEIHKFLWTYLNNFCGSNEEFLKMVQDVNNQQSNILELCVISSSKEIFEFIIEELEKLTTRDDIRNMLSHLNCWGTNMLQRLVLLNGSPDLHESVWKVFRKYFETSEIVNFIEFANKTFGENLLFCAFIRNELKMVEWTWNEIKKFLNHDEQVRYLKSVNKDGRNLLERAGYSIGVDDIRQDKVEWIMKLYKEYKIDFTDEQIPSWYLKEKEFEALKKKFSKNLKY